MFGFSKRNNNIKKNKGDIAICLYKYDKPVILPLTDRYLNTLIVGPTGCGKLFGSFIPMIYQDIQNTDCGLTVIEPGDFICDKSYAISKYFKRHTIYFNPILPTCPRFNPMQGEELNIITNIVMAFNMSNQDSNNYTLKLHEKILTNSIIVLKRLYGNKVSLKELSQLISNLDEHGTNFVNIFDNMTGLTNKQKEEHSIIVSWFRDDYFKENSLSYIDSVKLRTNLNEFVNNKYLKDILTYDEESSTAVEILDFEKHMEKGTILLISLALGTLKDSGSLLGFLIMGQLQVAIFNRRNKSGDLKLKPNFLYINEFQVFNNPGFSDVLITGISNRVATHIGIQSLDVLNDEMFGINYYKDIIYKNMLNKIVYPVISVSDAQYFSELFNSISKNDEFNIENIINRKYGELTYLTYTNNQYNLPSIGNIINMPKNIDELTDNILSELYTGIRLRQAKA